MIEAPLFPKIDRTDVASERLGSFSVEGEHLGVSIELMIEAGSYITIAANIMGPDGTWTRDQAVIGGNMVRLYKLVSAMLDQTVQLRRETSFILARLAFETIVAIRFLLSASDNSAAENYVKHSLDHEKRILTRISENIESRNGVVLPIEYRMMESIARMFNDSNVRIEDLPKKKDRDWGGKNLFEKAQVVGLEGPYLAMFSGASQNVHGAWGDLFSHHLNTEGDGRYTPDTGWQNPRPQLLHAISLLSLGTVNGFAEYMGGSDVADQLTPHLSDLHQRIVIAGEEHEAFIARKTSASA